MDDKTREMLKTIRETQFINENEGMRVLEPNDYDYQEEIKKFKSQITNRVTIDRFEIQPDNKNVVFGGEFDDIVNFQFEFSLDEMNGFYIKSESLQMTKDTLDRITKLYGYYKNWSEEWSNKLITNYTL